MVFSQPSKNIIAQSNGKLVHFTGLLLGDDTGGLVADHVAFLAKAVEALNLGGRPADRLLLCSTSQLFFCQSRKLTIASDQEDLFAFQHARQKMMFGGEFRAKVRRRIDRRVDLAPD